MDFFRHLFGESHDAGADDCEQCQAEPDWYRMGMTPPRRRGRDLSRTDAGAFLDRLVHLRDRHGARGADDTGTGQSVESFLRERATPGAIQPYQQHVLDSLLYGVRAFRPPYYIDPLRGEQKPKPPTDDEA